MIFDPVVEFESEVRSKAKANGIQIYKGRGKLVNCPGDNMRVLGYFCDVSKKLAIATKDEHYLSTYVHESCHMDQYVDGCKYWDSELDEAYCIFSRVLSGEKISDSIFKEALNKVVLLEADCEIRTVEKIKRYKLPIDLKEYSQLANSYLFFHAAILHYKKWYKPDKAPSKVGVSQKFKKYLMNSPEDYLIGNHNVAPKTFAKCFQ